MPRDIVTGTGRDVHWVRVVCNQCGDSNIVGGENVLSVKLDGTCRECGAFDWTASKMTDEEIEDIVTWRRV